MRYNTQFKDNNFLTPTTYTQQLSEYAEHLSYEDLPAEVVERAKMLLLHTVGAALAAKDTPIAAKVCKMALEANGGDGGPTTVWGTGKKMASINASLVLGTLADALDWEDSSWTGHPSAGVIPCAWLAAEEKHRSGKELITGIVAAYEVYQRIAMAVQPSDVRWKERGWGLTNWQIFAAILPVCKLYGLDARRINQAIGLGCESSTIPTAYHSTTMSDFSHYEYGYRARDGFLIAKSVEKGINNNLDGLDAPRCYTGIMCGDGAGKTSVGDKEEAIDSEADMTWFTRDLGKRYLIMETLVKQWPADLWSQAPVEVVRRLAAERGFGPEAVEEIVVDPAVENRMWAPDEGYASTTHAQFSLPYAVAAALYYPTPGACWYAPERLKDPEIIALAKRVKAGPSPAASVLDSFKRFRDGSFPSETVTVRLKDGRVFAGTMDCPPGHPADIPSREAFVERFRVQAASALEGERLEQAVKALCSIENADDIAQVSELLK